MLKALGEVCRLLLLSLPPSLPPQSFCFVIWNLLPHFVRMSAFDFVLGEQLFLSVLRVFPVSVWLLPFAVE